MSAIFFLASLLAALLAVITAAIISFGNEVSQFMSHMTRKMGPGVIHPDEPASYKLVYLLATLTVALFIGGFYHIGR